MEIKRGQELSEVQLSGREPEEIDLVVSPGQAEAVQAAREQAHAGFAAGYSDSLGDALEQIQRGDRNASFLEVYKGPLSASVLASMIEASGMAANPA